jgi:hypothetical protein
LEQALGDRRLVVDGTTFWPSDEAMAPDVAHASADEVLARLERYIAARRAAEGPPRDAPPAPVCSAGTAAWARAGTDAGAHNLAGRERTPRTPSPGSRTRG